LLILAAREAGGTDFVWDGNGDANNGGDWSNPLNWNLDSGTPDDSGDNADISLSPNPTVDRFISNDVATTIGTLTAEDDANSYLVLYADLTLDTFTGGHDRWLSHVQLNGYTFTVGSSHAGGYIYLPKLDGPGTFIKNTIGTATLQGEDEFTGTMIVSDGTLQFRSSAWDTTTLMTVLDGATAFQMGTGASMPTNIAINGNGYNDTGALRFGVTDSHDTVITVSTDSKMTQSSGTTTLDGDVKGTGCLTLEGPGTWVLAGAGVTFTNKLIITNGTVQVGGDFPDLINIIVDQDGVLEALASQFPSGTIVTQNGGIWNQPDSASWTGGGDGSNWTDTANWAPPVVPTNVATIPYPASARTIFVDAAATVDQLAMAEGANNRLMLGPTSPPASLTYQRMTVILRRRSF